MIKFTEKQLDIRKIKQDLRLEMANLRSDISAAACKDYLTLEQQIAYRDEKHTQLDRLIAESNKHPDIVVKVRILVSYADGEQAEDFNYISGMKDYIADALLRFSENNKYWRELVASGACEVSAFPIEILELNPEN